MVKEKEKNKADNRSFSCKKRWALIIYNNDETPVEIVLAVLVGACGLEEAAAWDVIDNAQNEGSAIVRIYNDQSLCLTVMDLIQSFLKTIKHSALKFDVYEIDE